MNNRFKKALIGIAVLAYVISPVDAIPAFLGDDIVVALLGYLLNKSIPNKEEKNNNNQ